MKFKKTLIFSCLVLAFCFSGIAQEKMTRLVEKESRDSVRFSEKVEEVTVTAFHAPYRLFDAPAPVHLIVSDQLEAGSAFTPVEALNHVPGILMHHGTLNTNRLTIRGIGSRTPYGTNKIKSYFGEIPVTGGDGETTLEDIDNQFVQKVEIIKGPSSSLYGAGLGGAILFYPKTSGSSMVQGQITRAGFNTWKNTLSAGFVHKKLNTFISGSALNSDSYRENNSTNRINVMCHSDYAISNSINISALVKMTRMKAYIPSSIDMDTYLKSPEKAAASWNEVKGYEEYIKGQLGLSVGITPTSHTRISVAVFGNFRIADELRPFNLLHENSEYFGWRGYFRKMWETGPLKISATSGLEFFRENYDWSTLLEQEGKRLLSDNDEHRAYENLFIQMEMSFWEKLFLSTGINGNYTRFRYRDLFPEDADLSGNHAYSPVFSPRFGASYPISELFSFFGNVSHGFSVPSFEETLFPEGEINPGIKPESGWSAETGLRVELSGKFRATVSYYRVYIRNLLVARRTGEDAYVGVNAGKSLHPGLEAEMKWVVINPGSLPSLVVNGNVTRANYRFQHFIDEENNYSGNLLPGTARTTWLLGGNLRFTKNLDIRGWHRYTGEMPVDDANSAFTDPYGLSNIEIRYAKAAGPLHAELKAGVENIFNVKHIAMLAVNAPAFGIASPRYYYPGNPRNYFLSLQIRWGGF